MKVLIGVDPPKASVAFAAIDDVFGLLVIAFAYTATIDWWFVALAAAGYLGIVGLLRLRWVASIPYVLLGLVVWIGVFGSGIHPTIAGVAVGLLLPLVGWTLVAFVVVDAVLVAVRSRA